MVYLLPSSISVCKSVDQRMSLSKNTNTNRKNPGAQGQNHHAGGGGCDRSRSAAIDVVFLVAVVIAFGFLVLPSAKFLLSQSIGILAEAKELLREEVAEAPMVYGSVGLSLFSAAMAAWGVLACMSRKCGNPACRGLRRAAEFDIQLETEDCVRSSGGGGGGGLKGGLFELRRVHHRELEAELKKMAPPNGRAVLVFRARCGCSVGRLEVPGPKKIRKIKQ